MCYGQLVCTRCGGNGCTHRGHATRSPSAVRAVVRHIWGHAHVGKMQKPSSKSELNKNWHGRQQNTNEIWEKKEHSLKWCAGEWHHWEYPWHSVQPFFLSVTILQWNCRGLFSNLHDIHDLVGQRGSSYFCLHKHTWNLSPGQNIFRQDLTDVHLEALLPQSTHVASANLEASTVQVSFRRVITICSLEQKELKGLCGLQPFIILCDLNAHNPLWGSIRLHYRDKMFERVLLSRSVCPLNIGHTLTQWFLLCNPFLLSIIVGFHDTATAVRLPG